MDDAPSKGREANSFKTMRSSAEQVRRLTPSNPKTEACSMTSSSNGSAASDTSIPVPSGELKRSTRLVVAALGIAGLSLDKSGDGIAADAELSPW